MNLVLVGAYLHIKHKASLSKIPIIRLDTNSVTFSLRSSLAHYHLPVIRIFTLLFEL